MPLKKVLPKPGINRENTRYTNEQGWYVSDKVRFRQGTPEKIGGWVRQSSYTFLGVCRALFSWVDLSTNLWTAVGTNLKYYVTLGNDYYDITPLRETTIAGAVTFSAVTVSPFSSTITVSDTNHGANVNDFVTFSGVAAGGLGGNITKAVLEQEYQVASVVNANSYTITAKSPTTGLPVTSNASDSGNGGGAVIAAYQINVGSAIATVPSATSSATWGFGTWSSGPWGGGSNIVLPLRVWSQGNFGEDLIFGYRGGGMYYWDASLGYNFRATSLEDEVGASDVPTIQNFILISDIYRFVFAFGCNDYGSIVQDPMLIRWSDQEDAINWTPSATTQAGSLPLSRGSEIVTAIQSRQEILVWTDAALYSLQYLGAPEVWGAQLMGDNISIVGENAVAFSNGVAYWMGVDKFYTYNGRVQTLRCDLRQYIFSDINQVQFTQVCAGTNEGFNEIWWFYCSANSNTIDRYVIYNYAEDIWYYGTMARTAWLDSGLLDYPLAATYSNNLVEHENGIDDNETSTTLPIVATIESAEFDLDDGDRFMFVRRVLPDITFRGSTANSPTGTLTLVPMKNSGSGFNSPESVGGDSNAAITRTATAPIEQFTGQVFIRVRGRQLIMKFESTEIGTTWQLGSMRLDMKPDGRASGSGVSGG
jgi:hypothetical protein